MVTIKASAVLESMKAIRERLGEPGYQRMLDLLDPEACRYFREEMTAVQTTAWIPLDLFVRFLKADVMVSDGGKEEALVARAEATIERQLRGIYKVFVRLSHPESIVERIAAVHLTYFNGVQIERQLEEGRATVRYVGFEKQHQLIEHVIVGFYRKALQLCGAKQVEARFTTHIQEGARFAELKVGWS